ncbi:MAG: hypothetical protein ACRD0K_21780 [Egibacteraceae bacterium]
MPRRTISLTEYLDGVVAGIAKERETSYNAAVVFLLEKATCDRTLPYEGVGEGPSDLSVRTEEYLDELAAEGWDDLRHWPAGRSA